MPWAPPVRVQPMRMLVQVQVQVQVRVRVQSRARARLEPARPRSQPRGADRHRRTTP
jgi:hypothetical protein